MIQCDPTAVLSTSTRMSSPLLIQAPTEPLTLGGAAGDGAAASAAGSAGVAGEAAGRSGAAGTGA